jgi:hypothetical protein
MRLCRKLVAAMKFLKADESLQQIQIAKKCGGNAGSSETTER